MPNSKSTMRLRQALIRFAKYFLVSLSAIAAIAFLASDLRREKVQLRNWWAGDIVDFRYADNVTGFDRLIVPNIVHFIRLGNDPLLFIEVVCIRAAWLHQKPDTLMIHCDNCSATEESPYWKFVRGIPGMTLHHVEKPENVFGVAFGNLAHAADVLRIQTLMRYGGIYLDRDSYVVQSLDSYRRFEMTLGWPEGAFIGNQVLVAHKNARFLKLYYDSYRHYKPHWWYYNAGELPTMRYLIPKPELIHSVPVKFGVKLDVGSLLYEECSDRWRNYSAMHLFFNHRGSLASKDKYGALNLTTVANYPQNFGLLARVVLSGTTKLGAVSVKDIMFLSQMALDYSTSECEKND